MTVKLRKYTAISKHRPRIVTIPFYFSQAQIEKMADGDCAFFWISKGGAIEGEWRETLGDSLMRRISEQITFQERTNQNRRNDMAANIYILSACDAWAGTDSMRVLGVTTDETMLYAMLAAKIKAGDMEYDGSGEDAWRKFQRDFKSEEVNFNKLKYGFVQTYEDMQITKPISLAEFPEAGEAYEEITGAKAKTEMEKLGLDRRSLTYSVVEVRIDSGYICFHMPGICDRDSLEENDHYQEFMEDAGDTEVNVSVYSYSLGRGESEYPDEDELAIIERYTDELDEDYGIDPIQSNFFSFEYEAEQEY